MSHNSRTEKPRTFKLSGGVDRIRDLGAAVGQILPFPIDFDRRPYNTLALPCECVITNK